MGIRPKSTMENVLCPEISGTRYFVITGAYGYGHGILSHSLPGLTHTAYRLAVEEGFDKVLVGPVAKIRIVSPAKDDVQRLHHEWDKRYLEQVKFAVCWRLESLLRKGGEVPPGFVEVASSEPEKNGKIILSLGYQEGERHFAWVGEENFVERFQNGIDSREWSMESKGAPSQAPTADSGMDLWYLRRGWKSEVGTQPGIGRLQKSGGGFDSFYHLFGETPVCFYQVEEYLPKALDSVWEKFAQYNKEKKALEKEQRKKHRAYTRRMDKKELKELKDFFNPKAKR